MRLLSSAAAVVGGVVLVVRLVTDGPVSLQWVGLALLGVTALCCGLMLVPTAPVWLQGTVAVGTLALCGGVLVTLHGEASAIHVDAVVGGIAVVVFGALAFRGSPDPQVPATPGPSHRR